MQCKRAVRPYLLPALLCVTGASARADDYDSLLAQGRKAYEAGDLTAASQFYDKVCGAELLKSYPPARVALCHHQLAGLGTAGGAEREAERQYLLALESWKAAGPGFPASWCITLMNLGELYRRQHRLEEAEQFQSRAVAMARESEREQPELRPETLSRLGVIYQEMNRLGPATTALNEALGRFAELEPRRRAEEAYAWNGLGLVQLASGLQEDAETHLRRAVSLSTEALGANHTETASYQTNLALALIAGGHFDRAGVLLRRAKLVIEGRGGGLDVRLGLVLAELSVCAAGENKFALAEDYARQAVALLSRQTEPNPTAIALAQVNLADVYLRAHRLDDADAILPGAVAAERKVALDTRLLADGLRRLADLRSMQHSWPEALALYREAIGLYERKVGPNSPILAAVLRAYADAIRRSGGSKSAAREIEARARAVESAVHRS